jgi:hypothetical protein
VKDRASFHRYAAGVPGGVDKRYMVKRGALLVVFVAVLLFTLATAAFAQESNDEFYNNGGQEPQGSTVPTTVPTSTTMGTPPSERTGAGGSLPFTGGLALSVAQGGALVAAAGGVLLLSSKRRRATDRQ